MSLPLRIFITGATGYVGGGVLARLLRHKDAASFSITALVRSLDKGEKLKALGINIVVGSYTDADLSFITDQAAQSDIVFAIADSDQVPAVQAILKGLKIRFTKAGKAPILIHTSGTAIISDNARGLTSEHISYSDLDVEKLNAIPVSVFHRNVDIPIIEADKAGYIKSYIIIPSAIYGRPSANPLLDLGIQNTTPLTSSYYIKPSVLRKQGGYFGKGLNCWSGVSVDETAELYLVLFDAVRKTPEIPGHGVAGYYFASSSVIPFMEMARTISEALFDNGIGNSREPSAFTEEEINSTFGPTWRFLAAKFYAKADRSRALGWNPKSTKADFLADVREEVKSFLVNAY